MARILIVDDDAALREGIAETHRRSRPRAGAGADGEAALARLAGAASTRCCSTCACRAWTASRCCAGCAPCPPPPPVAVLTAVPTAANTIEAMRLGAVDHLAKPVGRDDLPALIGAHAARPGAPPAAPPPAEAGEDDAGRLLGADARGAEGDRPAGRQRGDGADHRRDRHRQGGGGARHPPPRPPRPAGRSWR